MTEFNIKRHIKLSIALEIIVEEGFGVRRGLAPMELLVLDETNEIKTIIPTLAEANGFEFVERATIVKSFAALGVILK